MDTAKDRETVVSAHAAELWNIKTVIARTGLSRSTLYAYIERGLFPRQRVLGPRRGGWLAAAYSRMQMLGIEEGAASTSPLSMVLWRLAHRSNRMMCGE